MKIKVYGNYIIEETQLPIMCSKRLELKFPLTTAYEMSPEQILSKGIDFDKYVENVLVESWEIQAYSMLKTGKYFKRCIEKDFKKIEEKLLEEFTRGEVVDYSGVMADRIASIITKVFNEVLK